MWIHTFKSLLLILPIIGAVILIINDEGDSGHKLAWLLTIALLPAVGLILYLCFGLNQRHHWLFKRHHRRFTDLYDREHDQAMERLLFSPENEKYIKEVFRPLARLLGKGLLRVSSGNDFEIITSGRRKFELLMEDLRNAKESIHMEYFRFGSDRGGRAIRDLIQQKAAEGVKVRFINENLANFPISARYYNQMRKYGVEVVRFTSPRQNIVRLITKLNYRNHRKIVVIDGKIGYTGGMNINDKYFLSWRDTHLRITGDAVASLQFIFMDSWLTAGGTIDKPLTEYFRPVRNMEWPDAGSPHTPVMRNKPMMIVPDEPDAPIPIIQMSYEWGLFNAKEYFYIQTPYFAPPESVLNAMKAAASQGVDIRLMLPREVDTPLMLAANRSYYRECLEAGVRIFERGGEFIHSKTFVMDGYLSSIGTANLDNRSFSINYETNAYIFDEEAALRCREIFEEELGICREITLAEVEEWPRLRKFWQKFIRLFAPLL